MTEQELFAWYRRDRSIEARNALIEHFLPAVRRLAAAYWRRSHDRRNLSIDDLVHDAIPALVRLIETFDPDAGNQFLTFASLRILGQMADAQRSRDWVPRTERAAMRRDPDHAVVQMVALPPLPIAERLPAAQSYQESGTEAFWAAACEGMREIQKRVLLSYFRDGMSMRQIGNDLGVCESRISQIAWQACETIRRTRRERLLVDLLPAR